MQIESSKDSLPWVEKYRPKNLSQLLAHQHIVNTLMKYIEKRNFPHLLLYGQPGVGKTSTILACIKELYGKLNQFMVLELNASDDRGIDIVRNRIKQFAESSVPFQQQSFEFKVVILDEADAMTKDAQAALRRMMEKYSKNTRFCLICNHVSNIIPALQSRCTKFKFKQVPVEVAWKRVKEISEWEGMTLSEDVI